MEKIKLDKEYRKCELGGVVCIPAHEAYAEEIPSCEFTNEEIAKQSSLIIISREGRHLAIGETPEKVLRRLTKAFQLLRSQTAIPCWYCGCKKEPQTLCSCGRE